MSELALVKEVDKLNTEDLRQFLSENPHRNPKVIERPPFPHFEENYPEANLHSVIKTVLPSRQRRPIPQKAMQSEFLEN